MADFCSCKTCISAILDGQMRKSGDLDWAMTFSTDLNIDVA